MKRFSTLLISFVVTLVMCSGSWAYELRKGPYLIYSGDNRQMNVFWQLYDTKTCQFEWNLVGKKQLEAVSTTEYGEDHQHVHTIDGLVPGERYEYRIRVEEKLFEGTFQAAPSETAKELKFIAYGDSRAEPARHNEVTGGIMSLYQRDPDFQTFVLVTGDIVDNGRVESDWDSDLFNREHDYTRTLLANVPYQSCIGNHELYGPAEAPELFTKYFPYPYVSDRYWSFDYGPVHIAVVDHYVDYGEGSPQLAWLERDLAATEKKWKFVCFHKPGWAAGGKHPNDATVQDFIQPLCEEYGVAAVFAGHSHYYARSVVNGVQHLTVGGGGALFHTPLPNYPNNVASAKTLHYCAVEIAEDILTLTALKPDGTVIDSVTVGAPPFVEEGRDPEPYSFLVAGHAYGSHHETNPGLYGPFLAKLKDGTLSGNEFLVLTGDFIRDFTAQNWDILQEQLNRIGIPVYLVRGSHEKHKIGYTKIRQKHGRLCYWFDNGGERFIVLDNQNKKRSIPKEQLVFLKESIKSTREDATIFIFVHYLMWFGQEGYEHVLANQGSRFERTKHANFWREVYPLLQTFPDRNFFIIAGDVAGRPESIPAFYEKRDNVTFIASGMGEILEGNVLKVTVSDGRPRFDLVPLFDTAKIEKLEYYSPDNLHDYRPTPIVRAPVPTVEEPTPESTGDTKTPLSTGLIVFLAVFLLLVLYGLYRLLVRNRG